MSTIQKQPNISSISQKNSTTSTMVTSTDHAFPHNPKPRVMNPSLGYDFALLGLNASEARVEVIREAAERTAARIQEAAREDREAVDGMLCDLASSTYRLLDPRRRSKTMERVQLSIYSETDLELQKSSRSPLINLIGSEQDNVRMAARHAEVKPSVVKPCSAVREIGSKKSLRCRLGTVTVGLLLALATVCGLMVWTLSTR